MAEVSTGTKIYMTTSSLTKLPKSIYSESLTPIRFVEDADAFSTTDID